MKQWSFALLVASVTGLASPAFAGDQPFEEWLVELRAEAGSLGISESTLDAALSGIEPLPRVIELDRSQPEFTLTLETYLNKVVSATRVKKAREKLEEHRGILKEVSEKFGVQPRFIVALWGIETNFGQHTGGFSGSAYFRKELLNALQIIEEGHISAADMKGSWAGAMGQSQFMPSSFLNYAYDYNGDGRRDIWTTRHDVFASIANYLGSVGWRDDMTWGRQVRLPDGLDGTSLSEAKSRKNMEEWRALGVLNADGGPLPARNLTSRLVIPSRGDGKAYLAYANYDNILKWNRSNYFAIAVGQLADMIEQAE
ncbi:MAG: lytic murein transglycosylase [Proteobacteria bacterium]|nr:lytic murein transglycosylase [Pseudomonadota bacterium]